VDEGLNFTPEEDEIVIKKAKLLIEQSKTKEQLKTTKNFIELFTRDSESKKEIKEELIRLWLDKDKLLFPYEALP
jgi:sugar diacid utilization regulator